MDLSIHFYSQLTIQNPQIHFDWNFYHRHEKFYFQQYMKWKTNVMNSTKRHRMSAMYIILPGVKQTFDWIKEGILWLSFAVFRWEKWLQFNLHSTWRCKEKFDLVFCSLLSILLEIFIWCELMGFSPKNERKSLEKYF